MGRVPQEFHVPLISNFLDGRAADFYEQRVSSNPEQWTLAEVFEEMFNYIFPPDFRLGVRRKIDSMQQGNRSVNDYVHAMEEQYNLLGNYDEVDRVVHLFEGFKPSMQSALWMDRLHPEKSTWDEVVEGARIIELAEASANRVHQSHHSRSGNQSSRTQSDTQNGSHSQGYRSHGGNGNGGSSRASNDAGRDRRRSQSRAPSAAPSGSRTGNHSRPFNQNSNRNSRAPSNRSRGSSNSQLKRKHTPEKEAELRAAGKCFICEETAPGMSNHNIDIPEETSENEGSVLEDMPYGVHAIGMKFDWDSESDSEPDDEYSRACRDDARTKKYNHFRLMCQQEQGLGDGPPYDLDDWANYSQYSRPRKQLGHQYEMVATNILNSSQPYPGDPRYIREWDRVKYRFSVHRVSIDDYLLEDSVTGATSVLPVYMLHDPNFRPAHWFAERRARQLNRPIKRAYERTMGDPISIVAECHLRDGIRTLYPSPVDSDIDPEDRFIVQKYGHNFYCISDAARDRRVLIPSHDISNPLFNLAGWYALVVNKKRGYEMCELPDETGFPERFDDARSVDLAPDDVSDTTHDSMPDEISEPVNDYLGCARGCCDGNRDSRHLGDVYAETLQLVLTRGVPYPGEKPLREMSSDARKRIRHRFIAYRLPQNGGVYEICDTLTEKSHFLPEDLLHDPRFNPAMWYARRCCRERGITDESHAIAQWAIGRFVGETSMGRCMERRLEDILASGAPFAADAGVPINAKVARFGVELDSTTRVRDPRLDLVDWYHAVPKCSRPLIEGGASKN
ncbi:hypothetical protein D9611_001722 [Ephemerocybe angulata]|uniref:Retrotransposon gag domain-containing protein n=1 Tax=Ephemerocybe angulata TaxID=980116 RepID=A0A8H5FMC3_9AGAR|nr:hypothetical protein D9611_001722 [Tulosesus angulatus]